MRTALLSLIFCAALASAAGAAPVARDAWMRLVPGQVNAAGYLSIANHSDTADALVGLTSDCCEAVEIHQMKMDGEKMTMSPVSRVEIGAQQTVTFEPMGYHIMLIGLKTPPREGEGVSVTLVYESGVREPVSFLARLVGATGTMHEHHE